jgi:hypothetical protein
MIEITKEELLVQKELWLTELDGFWHDAATAKEDLKIGKQVYSVLKEIIELKKELGFDCSLEQNRYDKGDNYYKAVDIKKPKFFKQYYCEDNMFLIKSYKTNDNFIILETEDITNKTINKICLSKESAIDFANDLLKKANELK